MRGYPKAPILLITYFSLLLLPISLHSSSEWKLFFAEPRKTFWPEENITAGLLVPSGIKGEVSLFLESKQPFHSWFILKERIQTHESTTFLWEFEPFALQPNEYKLSGRFEGEEVASIEFRVVSSLPPTHFLIGSTAPPEVNREIGATWAPLDLYNYAKLDGEGNFIYDPLQPSLFELGVERLIANGLRGFVWQGLLSGYVLHQPFESGASFLDPQIERISMQRSELGAQQARRYLQTVSSLGAMDEPGLNYGVVKKGNYAGQILSLFPDSFTRYAYEKIIKYTLPNDPRELPPHEWLRWMRWRSEIMGNFFRKVKEHIKRISPSIPFGQDIYASFAINDGTNPFSQRLNDTPTTHSFMFWRGVCEQSWSFALERVGVRDRRFHFASNTTYFVPNYPDEVLLAEMVTNYAIMDGVGMLWHLNFQDAKNLKPSIERLRKWGDFVLSTLPARHPIGVLYSFTEAAMRLKEAGEVSNEEIYRIPRDYAYQCFALYHAIRRAGFTSDIIHEWEIEEGGLKGRKILWLVGIRHPLPQKLVSELKRFIKEGGKLLADATTTWLPPELSITKVNIDSTLFVQRISEWDRKGQELWEKGECTEASKWMRQELSDELLDEYGKMLRSLLRSALGNFEIEINGKGIIPGKWVGGKGIFYLFLNDSQKVSNPIEREIGGKKVLVYPASDWGEAKGIRVSLGNLRGNEGIYILEGKDWSKTRRLPSSRDVNLQLDFEPAEMKIIAVLPMPIENLTLKANLENKKWRKLVFEVTCNSKEGQKIPVPLPLEIVLQDPSGNSTVIHRSTNAKGIYKEAIPLGFNAPSGKWRIMVKELFSGKNEEIQIYVPSLPPLKPRPLPAVLVFDENAIRSLLRSGKPIVVVIGEKASDGERQIAVKLMENLKRKGVNARIREENRVWRKGRYPKVFPAVERSNEEWKDLREEEREKRRRPWVKLRIWAGENGYPPTLPDAFEVEDNLILIGTDKSSLLIKALQRASILPRVANEYFPGRGRGLLEYAWSPFALGKDVVLVTGSDVLGVKKSADHFLSLLP